MFLRRINFTHWACRVLAGGAHSHKCKECNQKLVGLARCHCLQAIEYSKGLLDFRSSIFILKPYEKTTAMAVTNQPT